MPPAAMLMVFKFDDREEATNTAIRAATPRAATLDAPPMAVRVEFVVAKVFMGVGES